MPLSAPLTAPGFAHTEELTRLDTLAVALALEPDVAPHLAVGFSGGGDSLALLAVATEWARARGARISAFHVDHGLSSRSAAFAAEAQSLARGLGVDVEVLSWRREVSGKAAQAAARVGRHRLLAQACAKNGVHGLLLAHTLDDQAETVLMRLARAPATARSLAGLAEIAPSPAWPEGAGLAVLRPLLSARRAGLRARLEAAGLAWIEDPANLDPGYERVRARAALAAAEAAFAGAAERLAAVADRARTVHREGLCAARIALEAVAPAGLGGFRIARAGFARAPRAGQLLALEGLVTAAAGAPGPVDPVKLESLRRAVAGEAAFAGATLAGAALAPDGAGHVVAGRDAGVFFRKGDAARREAGGLASGVWDGRFRLAGLLAPGETIAPARGHAASLSAADRRVLNAHHRLLRSAAPVILTPQGPPRLAEGAFIASQALARRVLPERPRAWSDEASARVQLGFCTSGAHVERRLMLKTSVAGDCQRNVEHSGQTPR
ncbi:MAG: tRNA lysidine(34) synthetase TilS [Maricaulaceae bacterium]